MTTDSVILTLGTLLVLFNSTTVHSCCWFDHVAFTQTPLHPMAAVIAAMLLLFAHMYLVLVMTGWW